jgi:lamin tail-like protein
MIFINEWLPNPIGTDAKGEFVELVNNGKVSVNVSGWTLSTDGKKKFKLSGAIRADGYLLLPRNETKLALKNTDGSLFLYDAAGRLVDRSAFEGSAPEGESFNRVSYRIPDSIQQFVWGSPTPGASNSVTAGTGISETHYPLGVPLNAYHSSWFSIVGFAFATGVMVAAILWYAMRKDENVSQLFFGSDESVRL